MSGDLSTCFDRVDSEIRGILEAALDGRELSCQSALRLFDARGPALLALCAVADHLRHEQAGDVVTYVVNRNINFTNVCLKTCKFCAFSRKLRSEQGYFLDIEEVVRRAVEARDMGATEVCLQAGLAPTDNPRLYIDLCRAVKAAAPELHIHAFSPEEVKYAAELMQASFRDVLTELKDVGLGSLPGTSAEILDDQVRKAISPGRITTAQWGEVIRTAHDLGIPTTSTMMFGHVETAEHRVRHMDLLRRLQRETGGFTEFVPLSFVHAEAPLFLSRRVEGVSPGPSGDDVIRLYAIARLMLGATFRNIQASWVKEGPRQAQWLLSCGVNDLGGTLMNESISTSAGASHGQLLGPAALRHLIRDAGRVPAERKTTYEVLRRFDTEPDQPDVLDTISDVDRQFGSYVQLTKSDRFRYERAR